MSYGATLAWLLFGVTLVITLLAVPVVAALGLLRGGALTWSVETARPPRRAGAGQPGFSARARRRLRPRAAKSAGRSFIVTFVAVVLLAAFLSPLIRSVSLSIKSPQQVAAVDSPIWPASPAKFTYKDRDYPIYQVPIDGTTKSLALVKKGLQSSQFADPAAGPSGPLVTWQGSWRTLQPSYVLDPALRELHERVGRDPLSRGCCSTRSSSPCSG